MVCACPRTNPVVMISGRMVCWFCGNQRLPKPVDAADRLLYGPISQYVEGPTRRLYEIYQGRECMLELAGILYQLIGPCARNNSPSVMISCVGALNGCLRDLDRVPGSGLVRFVRTWGPVLGAHGYVSPLHVARDYFEGATYAIVTPTQYRGEERPLDSLPYDDVAGHVYQYSTNTITETEKHVMWTPGVTPGTEMCPLDKISFAASVLAAFPANLVARKSWIGARRGTLRVETNPEDCTLSFEHGKCWAQLFPDAKNELSIASCFGYQLPIGVQGKYIARRLQINGLKLVLADGGQWTAYTFHKGSWLGHIQPSHEPLPDEVHALATFNVVPYNEPSRLPLYKLPGRVYFGGSRYSCMASDPSWQDFLLPGFCWTQLFPMRYRVEEARLAIQRQQQSSEGVTGTYLMGRLLVRGIKAVESPTGTLYVYQSIAWPSVRHISIIPSNHSGVLVARLEITSLADPRDLFGFGPHWYGKRKRGGGSKSSDPAACDWGKAVEEQEKQLPQPQGEARPPSERIASSVAPAVPQRKAKKSKSSPPESANVTFGAPDDAKEKTTPAQPSNIREALVRPVVGTDNRIQISSKPGLPNQVFVPPPDGGCGLHAVQAIACHYRTGKWPEQSAKVCWDEKKWTDSDQLAELIGALHLPAGLDMGSGCSHCRYVISLESDHWVVFYYDNRPAAFSSCCAAGACASAVGTLAGMESPTWYDPSGVYDLLPCIESPEEYCNVVCGLVPRASLTKPRPVLRQRVLASLAVRPANEPAKVPCSYVREIHSKSDLNDCIPPKPNEAPCPASTDAIEKAQAAQEIARDTVAPDKPVGRAPFLLRATSYLQQHAAAASSRVFSTNPTSLLRSPRAQALLAALWCMLALVSFHLVFYSWAYPPWPQSFWDAVDYYFALRPELVSLCLLLWYVSLYLTWSFGHLPLFAKIETTIAWLTFISSVTVTMTLHLFISRRDLSQLSSLSFAGFVLYRYGLFWSTVYFFFSTLYSSFLYCYLTRYAVIAGVDASDWRQRRLSCPPFLLAGLQGLYYWTLQMLSPLLQSMSFVWQQVTQDVSEACYLPLVSEVA
ncbi:putative nsp2F protein [Pebjah virus]|uniref:Putative nsp2F protein n=1 Tax=Pebjah virus TaxID=1658615 RepID=A0A0G2UH88_9NIDO|nr:putative nsp2F protein [Pebjah virus]AKI29925.1 putative nsp2F protein [Pebjah virus]AKI29940.1 putative nsp2F protein [Pebjah virus]AKI29955.1 putative nsp2F protein [Pebjah virus]